MSRRMNLLTKAVNTTTSSTIKLQTVDVLVSYGGVFSGATVSLELLEQGEWETVTDGVFTSPGQRLLQLAQGIEVRAVVAGGDGSTDVNLSVSPRY
jgi:hypothetical protein